MKLYDLFGYREYMYMLDQGYVRENFHPTLDLRIINYTEKAQYDNEWNNVTTKCRGLIVNSEGTVIARPFDKFLNYGQNQADKLLTDDAFELPLYQKPTFLAAYDDIVNIRDNATSSGPPVNVQEWGIKAS